MQETKYMCIWCVFSKTYWFWWKNYANFLSSRRKKTLTYQPNPPVVLHLQTTGFLPLINPERDGWFGLAGMRAFSFFWMRANLHTCFPMEHCLKNKSPCPWFVQWESVPSEQWKNYTCKTLVLHVKKCNELELLFFCTSRKWHVKIYIMSTIARISIENIGTPIRGIYDAGFVLRSSSIFPFQEHNSK